MVSRCSGVAAPVTSSATTIGGSSAMPRTSASSRSSDARPAKKSTHTEVSTTTPATSSAPIDINLQSQFAAQCKGAIVETPALNLFQSFDDRFGDPLAGDLLRCFEKVARKIGSD